MFSATIRSALVALVASALAVSAAPGLALKVSTPESIDGVENLKVTTTLTNTGDVSLKLINDPRTILSTASTNSFAITDASGASAKFTGIYVKYSLAQAAKVETEFTVLAAGESVDVTHDLSYTYNLTATGAGAYNVEPSNLFHFVDESNTPVAIHATVEAATTKISGVLAKQRVNANLKKRASFVGCSTTRTTQTTTAAASAQVYQQNALAYMNSITASTTRYATWFGAYTAARDTTVTSHYSLIGSRGAFSTYTWDCTCPEAPTAYAYVYPDDFGYVYLCGAFWTAPNTGTDSRAGTIIHESSHFTITAGTDDHVYGQSGAKALAISSPTNAIDNADNHEYFAENTPAQS